MSVLAQVRLATRQAHQALEAEAGLIERLADRESRIGVLQGFRRLHSPAEGPLAQWLDPLPRLDFIARRKSEVLARDLEALGAIPAGDHPEAPSFACRGEALGFAYVLEGSTLGGRVIRKQLARRGCDLSGLGFFDVYGRRTGARWAAFCQVLEDEGAERPEAVLAGALTGFHRARQALSPASAAG